MAGAVTLFDPIENAQRIRSGLKQLLSERFIEFAQSNSSLIVVFRGEPRPSAAGRIHLFQEFVYASTGCALPVKKQVAACIKVFFDVEGLCKTEEEDLKSLLRSPAFKATAESLDIAYAQFKAQLYHPGRLI